MALTFSTMMRLGTRAPDFSLIDAISGKTRTLNDLKSRTATVVMFICNHCPYVKHVQTKLVQLAKDYQAKGGAFIAINSNDPQAYPEDAPDKMKEVAEKLNYPFPYLFDETQEVAKTYEAVCTPDFYIFDGDLECVYRGQLDDSRPGNQIPVTGKDLCNALDNLISGTTISSIQKPSAGCNIKWKS